MSAKYVFVSCAAVATLALVGALRAQPAPVVEGGTGAVPTVQDAASVPTTGGEVASSPATAAPPAEDQSTNVQAAEDEAAAAQAYKRMKMDEATAADDTFHANRTQANMLARDKAEADAAAAIQQAHHAEDQAAAARERGTTPGP